MDGSQPPQTSQGDLVDRTVHGYALFGRLGSGGMGEVYLARHLEQRHLCAFKVIRGDVVSRSVEARFRREAHALSRLEHANIVGLLDHGTLDDGTMFLVMPYVKGRTLQEIVDEGGALSVRDALAVLCQLSDALAHAHARDVVHRDLKPQNVVAYQDDPQRVHIIDFGLVRLLGADNQTKLTGDDQIVGSPLYMSPEQGLSGEIGWPADVYALAGVGYFLLTGRPPFVAPTLQGILLAQCYEPPKPLGELAPTLNFPAGLDDLLLQALAKVPEQRPRAIAMANALRTLLDRMPAPSVAATTPVPTGGEPPGSTAPSPSDIAAQVWADELHFEHDSEAGRTLSAMFNQITSVLIRIAETMRRDGRLAPSAAARLDRIRDIDDEIGTIEMDAALLDAELEESEATATPALERHVLDARARANDLRREQRQVLRELFAEVFRWRSHASRASEEHLGQLDSLIEVYTVLRDDRVR